MNTKIVAAVVVVVLLLGTIGYFVLGNKASKSSTSAPTPAPTKVKSPTSSLLDLLTKGGTQKCEFTYANENNSSNGTVYLSGTKLRADVTSKTNGKTSMFYMIRDGDTNYIWGTDLKTGIKMNLKAQDLETSSQFSQYFDTKQKASYSCASWGVDNSKFTPPSNIKFLDVSQYLPQTNATRSSSTTNPNCSACNYLSGSQKVACLSQLHCPAE